MCPLDPEPDAFRSCTAGLRAPLLRCPGVVGDRGPLLPPGNGPETRPRVGRRSGIGVECLALALSIVALRDGKRLNANSRKLFGVMLALLVTVWNPVQDSWQDMNLGVPFGKVSRQDVDRLLELSLSRGVDMEAEMPKAYKGDATALSRIFSLSTGFQKMDKMTRVYGNFIFSMFLDLGERRGENSFGEAVAAQPADVRQRVRDFVYHAITQVPRSQREEMEREVRNDFPLVFPADYVYGHEDPLFR